MDSIILDLYEKECIKIGTYKLKSGVTSPIYIDLKNLISYPYLMNNICSKLYEKIKHVEVDIICGVAYGGIPFSSIISSNYNIPMIFLRKEVKKYGTNKMIEGCHKNNSKIIMIEDVITTGSSLLSSIEMLKKKNLIINDLFVICDRRISSSNNILNEYNIHSLFNVHDVIDCLLNHKKIEYKKYSELKSFFNIKTVNKHFDERKKITSNNLTKKIFNLLEKKKTNIGYCCLETTKDKIIELTNKVAPHICILVLYPDIISDIDINFLQTIYKLSVDKKFFIFVDKFYNDDPEIFIKEYMCGLDIYNYSDLIKININSNNILKTFSRLNKYKRKGIIISQNSNQNETVKIIEQYRKDIVGIMTNEKSTNLDNILYISNINNINNSNPENIILKNNCDIVLINEKQLDNDIVKSVEIYKFISWNSYQKKSL